MTQNVKVDGDFVFFTLQVPFSQLVQDFARRFGIEVEKVQQFFEENPKQKKAYLKLIADIHAGLLDDAKFFDFGSDFEKMSSKVT